MSEKTRMMTMGLGGSITDRENNTSVSLDRQKNLP